MELPEKHYLMFDKSCGFSVYDPSSKKTSSIESLVPDIVLNELNNPLVSCLLPKRYLLSLLYAQMSITRELL